jgi:hypothetical protein
MNMNKKTKWESPKLITLGAENPTAGICEVGSINPTGKCTEGIDASGGGCREGALANAPCQTGTNAVHGACKDGGAAQPAACSNGATA